jgi:hypothetical protein
VGTVMAGEKELLNSMEEGRKRMTVAFDIKQ